MERQRNEPLLKKGEKKKVTETGVSGVFFVVVAVPSLCIHTADDNGVSCVLPRTRCAVEEGEHRGKKKRKVQ